MSRSHHQPSGAAARSATSQDAAANATPQASSLAPKTDRSSDHSNTTTSTSSATPADAPVAIGVGIDTSRYGHYATFLRADLQAAAADLKFVESAQGYQQLRQRLDAIVQKNGGHVHFHIRLDLAGRYADNLLAFLHTLPHNTTISCGDPQRNKNYRVAIFGHKKSDPVESAACARYALTEKPKPTAALTPPQRLLGQIASRLESQARQGTRVINQLHNLLARAFPELALVVNDLSAGWVLALLDRYPTAAKLAGARASSLAKIPYLPHQHIPTLLQHARVSVASLTGPAAEELVRELVGQAKDAHVRQRCLEKMLVTAYRQLPQPNHLDSIKGIGVVTAAILTAKIIDPHRFLEPGKLVGHFGIFPVEAASGIDRDGNPRVPVRMIMSKRGNDLVRRYLWMAALSAVQFNPAVKALYQRVRAKHPDQPSIAIGHAMRKLLHIALAVWKSGKPFNPEHYPWDKPAHLQPKADTRSEAAAPQAHTEPVTAQQERAPAAGHKVPQITERSVVTAAGDPTSVASAAAADNGPPAGDTAAGPAHIPASDIAMSLLPSPREVAQASQLWIDFEHLKSQLPLQRVLEHLDVLATLRGSASQRRGPCPVHAKNGQQKGRTFSVQLDKNVFQCFDPKCGIKGDVIDLYAVMKGLNLRDAAVELVRLFNLEPAPGTEKRHG
jgi:transposase